MSSGIDPHVLIQDLTGIAVLTNYVYDFFRKIKGKKKVEIQDNAGVETDQAILKLDDEEEIVVDKSVLNIVQNHPEISENISTSFNTLSLDKNVEGFEISHNEEDKFSVDKSEFIELSKVNRLNFNKTFKEEVNAKLIVVRAILEKSFTRK